MLATDRSSCLILSRSPDGDMRASPFQAHSIGAYARIQMLLAGGISFRHAILDQWRISTGSLYSD